MEERQHNSYLSAEFFWEDKLAKTEKDISKPLKVSTVNG